MADLKQEIREILDNFYIGTSIHGVFYFSKPTYEKVVRLVWLVIFLTMVSLCTIQSYENVLSYLEFNVKTSTVIEKQKHIEFPGITFCSTYWMHSEMFGNSTHAPEILASLYSRSQEELFKLALKMGRTCKSNYQSACSKLLETDYDNFDEPEVYLKFQNAWLESVKTMVSTFQSDVVKCWWKNKEVECSDMFINRFTDTNYCFQFNPGNHLVQTPEAWHLIGAYGLNVSNYDENTYNAYDWAKSKARMLLNVNKKSLCGGTLSSGGAGYVAILTNKDMPPLNSFDPPIKLRLSYVNNVIIKPKYYRRYTEHMGLCKSIVNLYMFPEASKMNMQPVCFLQCAVAKIFEHCNCYPLIWAPLLDVFRRNYKEMGIKDPNKTIAPCRRTQTMCVIDFQTKFFVGVNYRELCPECVQPCFEDKYEHQITYARINVAQLKQDITNKSLIEGQSDKDLVKGFLYVNFGFEDRNAEIVKETQDITIVDLFIFIGSNIGLFLGMSFMSNFEVLVDLILETLIVLTKHVFRKKASFPTSLNSNKETVTVRASKVIRVKSVDLRESRRLRNL